MSLKWPDSVHDGGMKSIMNDSHIETLEQVRQFLDGAAVMEISIASKTECYRWIHGTLVRFRYLTLGKADRGLIHHYLQQISGYTPEHKSQG